MPVLGQLKGDRVPVKMWARTESIESDALTQLKNVTSLPWTFHHVALMPDGHLGKGATGVDIGCGMAAVRTSLTASDLPDSLEGLRSRVEAAIPVGFHYHDDVPRYARDLRLWDGLEHIHEKAQDKADRARKQIGTLGGGNHFIELCLDEACRVWVMLHSGSRHIGKTLADIHISKAKELAHNQNLPDPDLAAFLAGTPEMEAYRRDLYWAQDYARENRKVMLLLFWDVLQSEFPGIRWEHKVECHHNYVAEEQHFGEDVMVTRKGAIRAGEGEPGIIPGSMGTKSYIVRGLGNPDSFESASHGAGRRMSRSKAKKRFTVEDLAQQTEGVCCRKDAGVLDEIPGAYKSIDEVMENQRDLVSIEHELRAVMCVKG